MASNCGIMFSKREGREKSRVGVCTCLLPVLLGQIALFLHSLPVLANVGRMQWIPFLYSLRFDCGGVHIVYRFEEVYVLHSGNERGWNEVSQHLKGKGKGGKCLEWQDVLFSLVGHGILPFALQGTLRKCNLLKVTEGCLGQRLAN